MRAQNNITGKTLYRKQKIRRGKVIGSLDSKINTTNQSEIAFFPYSR